MGNVMELRTWARLIPDKIYVRRIGFCVSKHRCDRLHRYSYIDFSTYECSATICCGLVNDSATTLNKPSLYYRFDAVSVTLTIGL